MIRRHKYWKYLHRDLESHSRLSFLTYETKAIQKAVLTAPIAISQYLLHLAPGLCSLDTLHILVVGCEWFDAVDDGRWYQVIPDLCEKSFRVEATLIGPDILQESQLVTRLNKAASLRYAPATIHRGRLEELNLDLSSFDLIVLFQPGFDFHHQEWMNGAFKTLVAAGKPIMATSWHKDEFAVDKKFLTAYGYKIGESIDNPLFHQDDDNTEKFMQWGRYIWQIIPELPPADFKVDAAALDQIDMISRMGGDSIKRGMIAAAFDYCERVEAQDANGKERTIVHITDHHFVDLGNREIIFLSPDGEGAPIDAQLTESEMASMPDQDAPLIERIEWGAAIKKRLLEATPAPEKTMAGISEHFCDNLPAAFDMLGEFSDEDFAEAKQAFNEKCERALEDPELGQKFHPLFYLLQEGMMNQAREIIQMEGMVNAPGPGGWTPLFYAVVAKNRQMIEWLLQNGADVNHIDNEGWTVLMEASRRELLGPIELLLQHGANLDHQNQEGYSAAHFAANLPDEDAFNLLRKAGASMSVRNKKGLTPLDNLKMPDFVKQIFKQMPMLMPRVDKDGRKVPN